MNSNAFVGNKKALSERDICSKFITPAIQQAGWDLQSQIREERTFSACRVIVRGRVDADGIADLYCHTAHGINEKFSDANH